MNDRAAPPALSECGQLARQHQPDRYLAALFAPAAAREDLFALYAFDHEIGKVRALVSQPMAGLIRLQWWRDALPLIAEGHPPAQPVALGLARLALDGRLPTAWLEQAIAAREAELEATAPADLAALEGHVARLAGGLTEAALALLGPAPPDLLAKGRLAGLGLGLVDLIARLPADAAAGRLWLPADWLATAGGEPDRPDLARRLAAAASTALQAASAAPGAVPRWALPALLPASLARPRLRRLARHGHDAATLALPIGNAALRLLSHRLLGGW